MKNKKKKKSGSDRSGGIPSPRQRSIHKTNDCVKSERGALVRGSNPHPLVTVFTTRPVILWALPVLGVHRSYSQYSHHLGLQYCS